MVSKLPSQTPLKGKSTPRPCGRSHHWKVSVTSLGHRGITSKQPSRNLRTTSYCQTSRFPALLVAHPYSTLRDATGCWTPSMDQKHADILHRVHLSLQPHSPQHRFRLPHFFFWALSNRLWKRTICGCVESHKTDRAVFSACAKYSTALPKTPCI